MDPAEPEAFERSVDMIRKLRDIGDTNGYTATTLLLVDWDDHAEHRAVTVYPDLVPEDVRPAQFFAALIDRLLTVTPVATTSPSENTRDRRSIPVTAADSEE